MITNKIGFYLVTIGVATIFLSSIFGVEEYISYLLIFAGATFYLYQVYINMS